MGDLETVKRLSDVKSSIEAIESFLTRCPRRFDAFCADEMFRSAVLYHVAVIGEAVNQILKKWPNISITSARKIVNTRNYIIHGYDSLDNEILWSIVINHIPILKKEIIRLMTHFEDK